jgi:ADP-heptose:LPS heptosyltransferase
MGIDHGGTKFPLCANDGNRLHLKKCLFLLTKVLIIRFSSIGDIVLTSPVVRNLKLQMHGGVEIHYLTKKQFEGIVAHNPHISKVHTITKSTNEVVDLLKAEHYDYVIDLHRNLRSLRVKKALKVLDFSFEKLNWEKWLLVNFGIDRLPDRHIVDRYMDCLSLFSIVNDNQGLDYFIPDSDLPDINILPDSHRSGYIAMAIGAAHWRKKPRLEQYIKICKALNYPIVLLGGPGDKAVGDEIASASGLHVWNASGAFSLHGSAWLVRESKLMISPDTGLMHIAAAFKKPIVSIWTATIPKFGMYPYQNQAINEMVEASHLTKRPCSKLGTKCKYRECRCVDELPLDKIIALASKAVGEIQ